MYCWFFVINLLDAWAHSTVREKKHGNLTWWDEFNCRTYRAHMRLNSVADNLRGWSVRSRSMLIWPTSSSGCSFGFSSSGSSWSSRSSLKTGQDKVYKSLVTKIQQTQMRQLVPFVGCIRREEKWASLQKKLEKKSLWQMNRHMCVLHVVQG